MEKEKKKGLGKGLSALIPPKLESEPKGPLTEIEVSKIRFNPLQPRENFNEGEIEELKKSIANDGLLQPIVVTKSGNEYILIAGERRVRAIRKLGWEKIPAVVVENAEEVEYLRKSLVENIQRTNLNPIEEATAYKKLIEEYGYSLERVANEVGKDFSTISNTIRLLNLPADIQEEIKEGYITPGHARALLMVKDEDEMRTLVAEIKHKKLSVRKVEEKVRAIKKTTLLDPNMMHIIEKLQQKLGTKVRIITTRKGGRMEIQFLDNEDLHRLVNIICGEE
ncbi:MAG TPA: ParB/RepB/Spo0J family partition protein [Candidatus Omnitrophica bacterium]|nr:ParB/RepB/Spo0J family partition protein [Candidatus Omnitrophota bacterium]